MADKEGINDKVLQKQMRLQNLAVDKIKEICKGKQPFATVRVTDQQKLDLVNSLGYQDVAALVQEFGMEKVNQLIGEAKLYEQKQRAKENTDGRRNING